ncbi:hypothetical protein TCDM_12057 [Trypanosoma cruzi Dm28c]|uniref:Uncharacterized protein n=1 Tax=Trypanosoma cruzi Dm28c TaxID=1416333 RepID=V5AYV0_TRYCR|nr:hypothetical protein TCDM_12057 [Trypanosoma cruzi Dm28c]
MVCASWGEATTRVHARGHTHREREKDECVCGRCTALSPSLSRGHHRSSSRTRNNRKKQKRGGGVGDRSAAVTVGRWCCVCYIVDVVCCCCGQFTVGWCVFVPSDALLRFVVSSLFSFSSVKSLTPSQSRLLLL